MSHPQKRTSAPSGRAVGLLQEPAYLGVLRTLRRPTDLCDARVILTALHKESEPVARFKVDIC